MKLRNLFLAAIVALGMVACNNEDVPAVDGAEGTVTVKVVPTSKGAAVRATGDLSNPTPDSIADAESAIKVLEVFIFDKATGAIDGYGKSEGSDEVKEIATHAGEKEIMVVANASIGVVSSKSELQGKTKSVPVVIGDGLVMTGESGEVTLVAGQNYYGYATGTGTNGAGEEHSVGAPLKITRVNARVAIVDAKVGALSTNQQAIFDGLIDAEVAIFNVPKTTKLFGTSLATNANYLFGEAWPTTANSYMQVADGAAVEGSFKDATVTFPIVNTNAPYYYVNENTSATAKEQMLIVLRAKPYKGTPEAYTLVKAEGLYTDADGYTYYPVWVNAAKNGYAYDTGYTADSRILRNTQYNITLLIKGIGNPTIDEVEEAFLDVLVAVEDWAVVNQNVEWN